MGSEQHDAAVIQEDSRARKKKLTILNNPMTKKSKNPGGLR
jgi:hypothetical protein